VALANYFECRNGNFVISNKNVKYYLQTDCHSLFCTRISQSKLAEKKPLFNKNWRTMDPWGKGAWELTGVILTFMPKWYNYWSDFCLCY